MESRIEKINEWIRPEVRGLQPYVPEAAGPQIRLDANESPFDIPEDMKQEISKIFMEHSWNRYPDPECRELKKAVAHYEGVAEENIVLGNGSDEIIRDLQVCFGGQGTRTVFPTPTFAMYRLLTISLGGTPVGVRLRDDWSLDKENLLKEMETENSRILFIASPNNPTGNAFDVGMLEEIVQATDGLVVVDEAYRLFGTQTMVPKLAAYPNLVVLNTYSKSMSAAGIRIGYLLGHEKIVNIINRVRLPYNLDAFAQVVALKTMENVGLWKANAKLIVSERERMAGILRPLEGVVVYPSQSNFLLIQVPDAEAVKDQLARNNIAVRGFPKTEGLSDCLRVTIGTVEENNVFLDRIQKVLQSVG
ncbi:histidinol-phosphate transaminase [bacterium]|nr:histidinol-phosphate transaminase [bacterium]